jgi:Flp pilus assembly protein TadD
MFPAIGRPALTCGRTNGVGVVKQQQCPARLEFENCITAGDGPKPRVSLVAVLLICVGSPAAVSPVHGQMPLQAYFQEPKTSEVLGVTPGWTTLDELLENARWGTPTKNCMDAEARRYLLYQVDKFRLAVTLVDDVVQTIDVKFAEPTPLSTVEQGFRLGLSNYDALPPESRIGIEIAEGYQTLHYSVQRAVVYVAGVTNDLRVDIVRFYAEPGSSRCSQSRQSIAETQAGVRLCKQRDFAGAVERFNTAIELDRQHVCPYGYRSGAYSMLGDFAKAIADGERVVELKADVEAYSNLAYLQIEGGRYEAALQSASKAVELDGRYPDPWKQRGIAAARLGDFRGAKQDLDAAIARDARRSDCYLVRGQILAEMGRYHEALADAEQVLNLSPNDAQGTALRDQCYRCLGSPQ